MSNKDKYGIDASPEEILEAAAKVFKDSGLWTTVYNKTGRIAEVAAQKLRDRG